MAGATEANAGPNASRIISAVELQITKIQGVVRSAVSDWLAVEEPLEIQLGHGPERERQFDSISVTMRTPGHDAELAVGFLLTEGIIQDGQQVAAIHAFGAANGGVRNTLRVDLHPHVPVDLNRLERHFYTTSSCGVCGKASIDAIRVLHATHALSDNFSTTAAIIHQLPHRLRQAQAVFDQTGGLHAAALFNSQGHLETLREDVGRHNAVDKLIGSRTLAGGPGVPFRLSDRLLFVSGRASFELVQKALMAGIPLLCAVGAPSSLAVELAREFGMTVIGFVRDNRFNIYCGEPRVR